MSNFGTKSVVILCPNFFTFFRLFDRREAKFPEFFYDFDRDLVTRLPIYDFSLSELRARYGKHRERVFQLQKSKKVENRLMGAVGRG